MKQYHRHETNSFIDRFSIDYDLCIGDDLSLLHKRMYYHLLNILIRVDKEKDPKLFSDVYSSVLAISSDVKYEVRL
jgi:hypothetical protein